MALTSYAKVTGKKSGEIKGSCQQGGDKKDKILVYGIKHDVTIPRDNLTGLPTGQRVHSPFVITKSVDKASPNLYKLCTTGEHCDVEVDYYRIKEDGTEEKYYTVKLADAIVVAMNHWKLNVLNPDNKPFEDSEDVAFTYSKITWNFADGNIEHTDDWKGGGK